MTALGWLIDLRNDLPGLPDLNHAVVPSFSRPSGLIHPLHAGHALQQLPAWLAPPDPAWMRILDCRIASSGTKAWNAMDGGYRVGRA
jgi:hypothetical protein